MHADRATPTEARALAEALRALSEWAFGGAGGATNEVVRLVREHLGPERLEESVVTRQLPAYEHVNLQAALDRWMSGPSRTWRCVG